MDGSPHREAAVVSVQLSEDERTLTVTLDDGSRYEIAPDAAEARGLAPGLALSPDHLQGVEAAAERKRIARQLFAWLDRRPRSRLDLRQRLVGRGFDAEACDRVLDGFVAEGLVDDRVFAGAFVRTQLLRRPVGPLWLLARLRQEGVSREDASAAVSTEIQDEPELARQALVRKKFALEKEKERGRALRFLESRGFHGAAARAALQALRREESEGSSGSN